MRGWGRHVNERRHWEKSTNADSLESRRTLTYTVRMFRGDAMTVLTVQDLAVYVQERRRDLGWTQAELARRAGCSRQWVNEFESGKPTAELYRALDVCDALGLDITLTFRGGTEYEESEDV